MPMKSIKFCQVLTSVVTVIVVIDSSVILLSIGRNNAVLTSPALLNAAMSCNVSKRDALSGSSQVMPEILHIGE